MEYLSFIIFMAWASGAASPPTKSDIEELKRIAYSTTLEV